MEIQTAVATLVAFGGLCGLALALYLHSLVLLFMLASAIPHRPVVPVVAADLSQSRMKGVRP